MKLHLLAAQAAPDRVQLCGTDRRVATCPTHCDWSKLPRAYRMALGLPTPPPPPPPPFGAPVLPATFRWPRR